MGIKVLSNKILYRITLFCLRSRLTTCEFDNLIDNRSDRKKISKLTRDEKKLIRERRAPLGTCPKYRYWKFYKTYLGFNEDYIANDDIVPIIIRCLNPKENCGKYMDKSIYPEYFSSLNIPKTYVICKNNILYDGQNKVINFDDAVNLLKEIQEKEGDFVIKPTINSRGGIGVKRFKSQKYSDVNKLLKKYYTAPLLKRAFFKLIQIFGLNVIHKSNFICQEVVKQSKQTEQLHPPSLNTFRVSTLNINDNCTVSSVVLKHGMDRKNLDNINAGGVMVGVNQDGQLSSFGYGKSMIKYTQSPTGISYKDVIIDKFPELLSTVVDAHRKLLPDIGFAGWDVALNEDNQPVLIEVNVYYPGIMFSQLATGSPIFGNRTNEVFEFITSEKEKLTWRDNRARYKIKN